MGDFYFIICSVSCVPACRVQYTAITEYDLCDGFGFAFAFGFVAMWLPSLRNIDVVGCTRFITMMVCKKNILVSTYSTYVRTYELAIP